VAELRPGKLLNYGNRTFRRALGHTSLDRAYLPGLLRNAVALGWESPETAMPAEEIRRACLRFPLVLAQYREFYGRDPDPLRA